MKVRQQVYNAYWKTAAERQEIFFKKVLNQSPPFTQDPIFLTYKFCNVYRASDRVSQFLIKDVIYKHKLTAEDALFRVFLFRLLNKIETWQSLERKIGLINLKDFNFDRYDQVFENIKNQNRVLYGNAFILCANKVFGYNKKHQNHLALLEKIFKKEDIYKKILAARSLNELFLTLRDLPLIGDFMAYQIALDFNYSEIFDFSENEFTIAGPGAQRGIKKCFLDTDGKSSEYIIQYMVERQEEEFKRLGIPFKNLWGRSMQAIDCQGWFCETDKYSRVKFPALKSNRVRIKAEYKQSSAPLELFYPPKWGINQKMKQ